MILGNEQHYAYDLEYSHIVKEIITPVTIYSSRSFAEGKCIKVNALWDTGANHSVITPRIANELNLVSIDKAIVGGIDQVIESDIVIVAIVLPNNMLITEKRFSVNNIPGADVLIGMDIIMRGDFVITNTRGKTLFSFVIPTLNNRISFSKMINQ
jgi:predicted aspartyl protease